MKKGWVKSKFGDVCQYRKDNGVHKNLQYVGMEHIGQGNGLLLGTIDSNSVLSTSFRFQKGDVLYGRLRPYLKKACVAEFEGCCSTEIFPIFSEHIDASFLKYWLLTDKTTTAINNTCSGCRMPRGNMNEVLNFDFYYPPISEQKEIVEYLDSSFAKIDKLKENAAKNLEEAKALFQSALKDALEPKEGWEEKKLQDICQIKGGKRLPKGYVLSSEPMSHRYITVADFTKNGTVVPSTVKYISDEVYKTIQRYTITSDDVYVTIVGSTVGKAGIIPPELDGANLTENACKLVLNKDYDKRFVYYLMCSEYVIRQEQLLTKVSAQPKLALTRLASIFVYMPSLQEQQSIVSFLDSLNEKVNTLQQNYSRICDECDALKQAILRQVFE